MKMFFVCTYLVIGITVSVFAQNPVPTPVPQQTPNQAEIMRQKTLERQEGYNRLRGIREPDREGEVYRRLSNIYSGSTPLYRKTSDKELKLLAPKSEDLEKYSNFLRQPDTGIIKLAADKGCSENTNIVVATPECIAYTMPGAGSSYSFRVKDYRIPNLADITFTQNSFQATGVHLHGIFVEIGDVPMEQVNLQTKGMKFVTDFPAPSDYQKAKELDLQLIDGINTDGFLYRRAVKAEDNMTYVLRSVAYRGKYFRAVNGITYNELELDKRKDVTIAFRIIRHDEDGAVTIIWKQLAIKDSPKIKRNKNR